jgi:hypothetical protein
LWDVNITLHEWTDPNSQLKSWSGYFTAPAGAYFEPGEYYTLELEDGRSGSLFISVVNVRSGVPDSIQFVGTGELK